MSLSGHQDLSVTVQPHILWHQESSQCHKQGFSMVIETFSPTCTARGLGRVKGSRSGLQHCCTKEEGKPVERNLPWFLKLYSTSHKIVVQLVKVLVILGAYQHHCFT